MMRSKFASAILLGVCLSVFSSVAAFAETGDAKPASVAMQAVEQVQPDDGIMTIMEGSKGSGISGEVQPAAPISKAMLKKQDEINKYLFEQHKDEIKQLGFTVTHTAPFENFIEIGIAPYNETNAGYLYSTFGRDMVRIVEGVQAVALDNQTTAYGAVGSKIFETQESVPDVIKDVDPLMVHGRDGEPAENERGQIYTATAVSAPAGAPEMAETLAADPVAHPVPITAYVAAVMALMAIAAVLIKRYKVIKS